MADVAQVPHYHTGMPKRIDCAHCHTLICKQRHEMEWMYCKKCALQRVLVADNDTMQSLRSGYLRYSHFFVIRGRLNVLGVEGYLADA